jgi:hypothetical protein
MKRFLPILFAVVVAVVVAAALAQEYGFGGYESRLAVVNSCHRNTA